MRSDAAARVDFSEIRYAQVWEDADVLLEGLDVRHAGLGGCARYALNETLNRVLPSLPLGTLASNLIGGYLVGVAVGLLAWRSDLSPLWRLFLITGVLGGLTTFSTFSA